LRDGTSVIEVAPAQLHRVPVLRALYNCEVSRAAIAEGDTEKATITVRCPFTLSFSMAQALENLLCFDSQDFWLLGNDADELALALCMPSRDSLPRGRLPKPGDTTSGLSWKTLKNPEIWRELPPTVEAEFVADMNILLNDSWFPVMSDRYHTYFALEKETGDALSAVRSSAKDPDLPMEDGGKYFEWCVFIADECGMAINDGWTLCAEIDLGTKGLRYARRAKDSHRRRMRD
jgi:hypothetical protein